jgi:metal-responsive CopG/Arc/MetJ family transcriptional regulator
MRRIQLSLDDELLASVHRAVKELNTTRSAFARAALREAVERLTTSRLEQKHRQGYESYPVNESEFSVWEEEQSWGDE